MPRLCPGASALAHAHTCTSCTRLPRLCIARATNDQGTRHAEFVAVDSILLDTTSTVTEAIFCQCDLCVVRS